MALVDGYGGKWEWLFNETYGKLLEELARIKVKVNTEKTRLVDMTKGEAFSFLGFDFRRGKTRNGKWGVHMTPRMKARTKLLQDLKDIFWRFVSQPVGRVIDIINPKLRGWANYFRVGQASRCFSYIKDWVEKKVTPPKQLTVTGGGRSLPLCNYPLYPKYVGGQASDAGLYICAR